MQADLYCRLISCLCCLFIYFLFHIYIYLFISIILLDLPITCRSFRQGIFNFDRFAFKTGLNYYLPAGRSDRKITHTGRLF